MASPYREQPRFLLCPRCAESLDRAFDGAYSCLRCEGLWLAAATLDAVFGDPRGPAGHAMWWRNSIACPACAFEGRTTVMVARLASNVLIDLCLEHGLWLDRGELGRLIGATSNELVALRDRLAVIAPELDRLVARRETWRADLELRRTAALDYQRALHDEQHRRDAVAQAERDRLAAFPVAHAPAPLPPPPPPPPPSPPVSLPDPAIEIARHAAAERAALRRHQLLDQRTQLSARVAELQRELAALVDHAQRLEAELASARQRTVDTQHQLHDAHHQLRSLRDLDV